MSICSLNVVVKTRFSCMYCARQTHGDRDVVQHYALFAQRCPKMPYCFLLLARMRNVGKYAPISSLFLVRLLHSIYRWRILYEMEVRGTGPQGSQELHYCIFGDRSLIYLLLHAAHCTTVPSGSTLNRFQTQHVSCHATSHHDGAVYHT